MRFEGNVVEGRDRTTELKDPGLTSSVRVVADTAAVRAVLGERMRREAARRSLIAEGRDMGTVVFPDAPLKLYMDADSSARTHRRWLELQALGAAIPKEAVAEDIARRDAADLGRATGPLRVPEHALVLDTSGLSVEAVVAWIVNEIRNHGLVG